MYRNHHEFHDSYYHHTCLIIPEKDVLETDIVENSFGARIVRWWNDLFLLSYTSGRTTGFYNSTHAMRIERFKQYRKFKSRIHPMSKFRNFWDFLILHVFVINKILFRFTSTFLFDDLPMFIFYLGAICEFIIIIDLYINLKTGYINHDTKRVILDTDQCIINLCKTKLFIYYASAIPLHWFMFLKYGSGISCGLCKANKFISVLKIISIFSLFRVYEASAYWIQRGHSVNRISFYKFIRIGVISIVTMCQYYDLSDVIVLLMFIYNGKVAPTSMLGLRAGFKYSGILKRFEHNYVYVSFDISRIFNPSLLFSLGIRGHKYYLDKFTSLFGYILAQIFYFWTLLECYCLVNRIMYPKDSLMNLKDRALTMLSSRQLSDELSYKVQQYFDFGPTRLKAVQQNNDLWRILPEELKKEAKLSRYLKIIMRIPFFSDLSLPILEQITLLLEEQIFLSNDILAEAWAQTEGLMIIDNGVLAVYSHKHKEEGHLIDGDYFGGISLVTDKELCMSYVVAITACNILLLEKYQFRTLMRNHPRQFLTLKMLLKQRYSNTRDNFVSSRRASELDQPPPNSAV